MLKKTYDFLKKAGIFYIATISDGKPKVRPFGFVMIYKNKLYFCTNSQKDVFKQMTKNNNIEICACIDDKWIRITGNAVFSNDTAGKEQVFVSDPGMKELYKPEDKIFEIFYLDNGQVTFYSMAGDRETGRL